MRKLKRKKREIVHMIIFTIMFNFILITLLLYDDGAHQSVIEQAVVVNVVDGDTIDVELDGVVERIRLIGVNTPEMGFFGGVYEVGATEATEFTRLQLAYVNNLVWLTGSGDDRDRWDRLRRYVWLEYPVDGARLLNQILIEYGHAVRWGD